jgi:hypothetical protein
MALSGVPGCVGGGGGGARVLTVQERAEWVRITGERIGATCDNSKPGPKGAIRAAARELNVGKDEAHRAVKIASIAPEAKKAARGQA